MLASRNIPFDQRNEEAASGEFLRHSLTGDTFPAQPFLTGERLGALDLLAAVVSKWSGSRRRWVPRAP